ncbi:lipopolysaccharide biosynthesis protein [Pseudoroseicyclus aestuarii]|uniref:Polysaccharide chain length determinant protein (PEP-CTERM system associated) n=1 Tax=Pseudoroseicyclus aestuarii TaxID=1795041 RepID=A0A318SZK2_9RHOB|nr:lipopolysaccharide biosynthesis protein [Pseudoroseicyclus aestuarii]PYE82217.1 polysaccharide chain length determinant protein (PEP-CTERM system associated) [Pseudoroseicyclus aestuarii]
MDIKFYLQLFLRRLPWFLLFLFMGTAAGVTLAAVLPPSYTARSTLIVESEQIPSDLAESTVTTEATEALQIIQQRILARDELIDLSNRLGVYQAGPGADRSQMTADEIVRDLRQRIDIDTGGGRNSATIVTVSFSAPSARLSSEVVNELVTMILQENVALRTSTTGQTLEFFSGEVERLDEELSQRGAEILAFQEENLNALPDSLNFRRSQQSAAQERLVQLERDEATLRDRRQRLVELYEDTGRVAPADPSQMSAEERQLQGLRDEMAAALAVLSPQHPRIRQMESRIAALEARVSSADEGTQTEEAVDPGLSAYQVQLADIDGQLEFIDEQKDQISATLEALRASIEQTPANAIRLQTLQRSYDAVQARYNQAVQNRARAETGDTIEALSKGQRISVVEPATPPAAPESPDRPLIAAAGVGGGLALGIGVIVLIELLNGAIRRPADLTARLGIAPFGTLPYIRTAQEARRRRAIIFGAFLVVLALPGLLWWVHSTIAPLDLMLGRVIDRLT